MQKDLNQIFKNPSTNPRLIESITNDIINAIKNPIIAGNTTLGLKFNFNIKTKKYNIKLLLINSANCLRLSLQKNLKQTSQLCTYHFAHLVAFLLIQFYCTPYYYPTCPLPEQTVFYVYPNTI